MTQSKSTLGFQGNEKSDSFNITCDLMHSQFPIEGSLYRQYSQTSVGTPNYKQTEFKWDYSYFWVLAYLVEGCPSSEEEQKRRGYASHFIFYLEIYFIIHFILKYTLSSKGLQIIKGSLNFTEGSLRQYKGKPFSYKDYTQLRLRLIPFHNSFGKQLENILHWLYSH